MARFGTEGRACRKYGQRHVIGADFERIVACFSRERKLDPARKSRLFNNLGCAEGEIAASRAVPDPASPFIRPAVVLVEDGRAMIATRPDTAFSSFRANPAANRSRFA